MAKANEMEFSASCLILNQTNGLAVKLGPLKVDLSGTIFVSETFSSITYVQSLDVACLSR